MFCIHKFSLSLVGNSMNIIAKLHLSFNYSLPAKTFKIQLLINNNSASHPIPLTTARIVTSTKYQLTPHVYYSLAQNWF